MKIIVSIINSIRTVFKVVSDYDRALKDLQAITDRIDEDISR